MGTNSPSHPQTKLKLCHRYNEPGQAHALTFSCFRGRAFFSRDKTRQWMIDAIDATREKYELDLWAYVIMPEHVHLLILPRQETYSISHILSSLKQRVAKKAIRYVRTSAPSFAPQMTDEQPNGKRSLRFWQRGGGYDRNIWSPEYLWETIDYIHANPVRRELCNRDVDWPWSSARAYHGCEDTLAANRHRLAAWRSAPDQCALKNLT